MNPSTSRSARRLGLGLLALVLPLALAAPAARAQSAKIFVALNGSDANPGSLGSPKRTFQAAHDAVAAGGEIVVLTTAGYSTLTITKSVAITVPTGVTGFITASGGATGVTINAASTDVVILRGLIIEGNGATGTGINAQAVGTLRVDNCTIRGFHEGIIMAADGGKIEVTGGAVRDCVTDGIDVGSATGTTPIHGNVTGCKLDNLPIYGLSVLAGTEAASVTATNCVISHCQTAGVYATGAGATAYVDGCVLSGNAAAAGIATGGTVVSRVTNTLVNNTTTTSGFTGTLQPQ